MKAKRVLILGAGAAGTIVANKLARELRREIAREEVEITILDKNEVSTNQAGFTFIPFGLYASDDITRPRRKLVSPRVRTILGADGEVSHLDLRNREVTARSGKKYAYDYLLIATGCVPDVESVPGLSKDFHTFYTSLEDALRIGDFVRSVEKGHVVISTAGMPIPCPGAPGKFAVLLDDYLRYARDEAVRKHIEITFLWPIEGIGPPAYNAVISEILEEKEIKVTRGFKLSGVDADKKEVVSAGGERIGYDFLITVPPFTSLKALSDSGLTDEKGWLPADKYTLQYRKSPAESFEEVYVVGDAGPAEILKTGIGAHHQALVTAQNLINDVLGNGVRVPYRGETGCPLVKSSYTPSTRGEAYIASWTYAKPLQAVNPTGLGWFLYRAYYYIYWDTTLKGLM